MNILKWILAMHIYILASTISHKLCTPLTQALGKDATPKHENYDLKI
jgi:hypothetical protein